MKVNLGIAFLTTTVAILFLLSGMENSVAQSKPAGIKTIVIDPGHGGYQPGCVYKEYLEKDITLSVGLLLGEMIEKNLPDVKVIYTRKTDVFVGLRQRTDIANKAGADLFISIHVNAVDAARAPSGALTLVMGTKDMDRNMEVAMRENDVIIYEEDYKETYQGYEPGSAESFIMFSLMQYANLDQSITLANTIQQHYKKSTTLPDMGVRQQPVLVLWSAAMPSVLTELGFLANDHDRQLLVTPNGQKKLATTLFNAISEYKAKVEGRVQPIQIEIPQSDNGTATAAQSQPARSESADVSANLKVVYNIQVSSTPNKMPKNHSSFKSYKGKVLERVIGGQYKYFVGECSTYEQAAKLQAEVRKEIPDAFMVAFRGDTQLSVSEARRITN